MIEQILARLANGQTMEAVLGGKGISERDLTNEKRHTALGKGSPSTKSHATSLVEIQLAVGTIESPLVHGMILAKYGQGTQTYQRKGKTESLSKGVCRLGHEIARHRKRDIDPVLSNFVAKAALEAWFGTPVTQGRLCDQFGIDPKTWRARFAQHYKDILNELFTRELEALRHVQNQLRNPD